MSDSRIISLSLCRNEQWSVGLSLRVALKWADKAVVLLHCCTDSSKDIVTKISEEHPGRVSIIEEDDSVWREMDYRHRMLEKGRELGGTHFATVDCDELVTANLIPQLRGWFESLKPRHMLELPTIGVWGSLEAYRADARGIWRRSWINLGFKDYVTLRWQAAADGYQYHSRPPFNAELDEAKRLRPVSSNAVGGIMHLQYANKRRLYAKHVLYQIDEVLRWPGRHHPSVIAKQYNQDITQKGIVLRSCKPEWWQGYDKSLVNLNDVPWQEAEVKRLIQVHGMEKFNGLNFFENR